MKRSVSCLLIVMFVSACVYAGNLEPSAAPGSTMKTLDQVEPRIPINSANTPGDSTCIYKITQSGSYSLTGNVKGQMNKSGIVIDADKVTIDLCGFTLQGVTGSSDGIRPDDYHSNIVIKNGIVDGWGRYGISTYFYDVYHGYTISYAVIEDVIVSNSGYYGIRGSYGGIIRNCVARQNGTTGILATNNGGVIENCTATQNGDDGFSIYEGTTMKNCSSMDNAGVGIYCGNSGHNIIGCNVYSNDGGGIRASGTNIQQCQISGNSSYGIMISFNCCIKDCNITANPSDGIAGVNISGNGKSQIEDNNVSGNSGYGINLTNNTGNFIYKNTLRNNTSGNLNVGTSNSAPYSTNPATAGAWYNIGM